MHVVDVEDARVRILLIVEVPLRFTLAVVSPERGCSHLLAVIWADCDLGELSFLLFSVRYRFRLPVDVLTACNADLELLIARNEIHPSILAAVYAFDVLDFLVINWFAALQVPAHRVFVLFSELVAMINDAAVVSGAVIHRLHGAILVRLDASLRMIFASSLSVGLDLDCRGHRKEHAGREEIKVHFYVF